MAAVENNIRNTIRTLILMALSLMIIFNTIRDLNYYFDDEVIKVNDVSDIDHLKDNAETEIGLRLNPDSAFVVTYSIPKQEFILVPFVGLDNRVMYVIEGPVTTNTFLKLKPPFKGRVVSEDFNNSWDVYGKSMKLKDIFNKEGRTLSDNALLIYEHPKESPGIWQFFIFGLTLLYLTYKGYVFWREFYRRRSLKEYR